MIGRAVLVLLGLLVVVLGLLFAAVGSSPVTVLAVALALGVGAACLREARHPGIH